MILDKDFVNNKIDIKFGNNRIGSYEVLLIPNNSQKYRLFIVSDEYIDPLRWTDETVYSLKKFLEKFNLTINDCEVFLDKSKISSHYEKYLFKWDFKFEGDELIDDALLPVNDKEFLLYSQQKTQVC